MPLPKPLRSRASASDSQSGGPEFESETMERYDKFGHVYQSA